MHARSVRVMRVTFLVLLLAAGTQWRTERRQISWLAPLALMLLAVIAVALASPGATGWVLWPVLVAALIAIASALRDTVDP